MVNAVFKFFLINKILYKLIAKHKKVKMNLKASKNCLEIGQISKLEEGNPHLTSIFKRLGIMIFRGN